MVTQSTDSATSLILLNGLNSRKFHLPAPKFFHFFRWYLKKKSYINDNKKQNKV